MELQAYSLENLFWGNQTRLRPKEVKLAQPALTLRVKPNWESEFAATLKLPARNLNYATYKNKYYFLEPIGIHGENLIDYKLVYDFWVNEVLKEPLIVVGTLIQTSDTELVEKELLKTPALITAFNSSFIAPIGEAVNRETQISAELHATDLYDLYFDPEIWETVFLPLLRQEMSLVNPTLFSQKQTEGLFFPIVLFPSLKLKWWVVLLVKLCKFLRDFNGKLRVYEVSSGQGSEVFATILQNSNGLVNRNNEGKFVYVAPHEWQFLGSTQKQNYLVKKLDFSTLRKVVRLKTDDFNTPIPIEKRKMEHQKGLAIASSNLKDFKLAHKVTPQKIMFQGQVIDNPTPYRIGMIEDYNSLTRNGVVKKEGKLKVLVGFKSEFYDLTLEEIKVKATQVNFLKTYGIFENLEVKANQVIVPLEVFDLVQESTETRFPGDTTEIIPELNFKKVTTCAIDNLEEFEKNINRNYLRGDNWHNLVGLSTAPDFDQRGYHLANFRVISLDKKGKEIYLKKIPILTAEEIGCDVTGAQTLNPILIKPDPYSKWKTRYSFTLNQNLVQLDENPFPPNSYTTDGTREGDPNIFYLNAYYTIHSLSGWGSDYSTLYGSDYKKNYFDKTANTFPNFPSHYPGWIRANFRRVNNRDPSIFDAWEKWFESVPGSEEVPWFWDLSNRGIDFHPKVGFIVVSFKKNYRPANSEQWVKLDYVNSKWEYELTQHAASKYSISEINEMLNWINLDPPAPYEQLWLVFSPRYLLRKWLEEWDQSARFEPPNERYYYFTFDNKVKESNDNFLASCFEYTLFRWHWKAKFFLKLFWKGFCKAPYNQTTTLNQRLPWVLSSHLTSYYQADTFQFYYSPQFGYTLDFLFEIYVNYMSIFAWYDGIKDTLAPTTAGGKNTSYRYYLETSVNQFPSIFWSFLNKDYFYSTHAFGGISLFLPYFLTLAYYKNEAIFPKIEKAYEIRMEKRLNPVDFPIDLCKHLVGTSKLPIEIDWWDGSDLGTEDKAYFDLQGTGYVLAVKKLNKGFNYNLILKDPKNQEDIELFESKHYKATSEIDVTYLPQVINQQQVLVLYGEEFPLKNRSKLYSNIATSIFNNFELTTLDLKNVATPYIHYYLQLDTDEDSIRKPFTIFKKEDKLIGGDPFKYEQVKQIHNHNRQLEQLESQALELDRRHFNKQHSLNLEDYGWQYEGQGYSDWYFTHYTQKVVGSVEGLVKLGGAAAGLGAAGAAASAAYFATQAAGATSSAAGLLSWFRDVEANKLEHQKRMAKKNLDFQESRFNEGFHLRSEKKIETDRMNELKRRWELQALTGGIQQAAPTNIHTFEALKEQLNLSNMHLRVYYPTGKLLKKIEDYYSDFGYETSIFKHKFESWELKENQIVKFTNIEKINRIHPTVREMLKSTFEAGVKII